MKNDAIRQFVRRELRAVTVGAVATAIGIGGGLPAAMANPVGGAVVSGHGSITSPNATTTLINQQSNSLILNWSSFNVASNETVQFVQPSSTSVALNNILSQSPSQIFGKIDANGRVVLINPNGILFGRTAQLNVGSLIASSLELKEFDPTTGHLTFQSLSGSPGVIDNEGTITAGPGGSVALLGGTVLNNGLVVADYGTVAMGAGNVATLDFYGGGLLRLQVSGDLKSNSTGAAAAVQNNGQIQANGGQVVLTATATQDVFASAVNNAGVIRANRVENVGGVIELSGPDGVVANSGTLDASGKGAGSTGGTVKVVGNDVGLFGTSTINASGPAGGGTVLVGGGFHGADSSVQDASRTYVGADTTIDADATTSGNGGNVAVWSNDGTRYYGNISAQGAGQGSGGYAEVSGKGYLDYEGLADLRAPSGKLGTLLLDPAEITIQATGSDTQITTTGAFVDTSSGAGSILTSGTINTQLDTSNVTVTTSTGDIVISGGVSLGPTIANTNTLTLNSAANISWDAPWSYTNNGQLTLYAANGSISTNAVDQGIALGGTSPLLMQATNGIGSSLVPVETFGLTSVAAAAGTGGIYIINGSSGDVTVSSLNNPVTSSAVAGLSATGSAISLVNNVGAITVAQQVAAGSAPVTLTSSGVISESGSGLITTTGGLTTSSIGGTTLGGANVVNSFNATNITSGNISLTNGAALTIAGMSQAGGGSITVNNAGGVGGTTVATTINAGTGSVSLTDTTGTLALGANNVSGAGVTLQGVGVTQSAGSTVDAGAGDILVDGGGAAIAMGGSLTTTSNTATATTIQHATTVALPAITTGATGTTTIGGGDISGAVTQSGTTVISTGTLAGSTTGTVTLGNANTIPTVGAFTSAGFTLNDGGPLGITGTLAGGAGGVDLTSSGTISETGSGLITTTGGLTTSSVGGTTLTGANVVNSFNATNTASGNISLTNGRALTIAGMSQAGGGSITVNNAGGVGGTTLNVAINAGAGSVTLKDTTGTLALGANNVIGAGVTLQGVGVTQLAASTVNAGAGDILVDGGAAAVNMAGSLTTTSNTATATTIQHATTVALPAITTGATGTTTIGGGDISGAVTQSGTTVISTGTLAGSTTGTVTLGNANTIPTVGAFTSAGFTLNDGGPLGITGTLAGGVGGVDLTSSGAISESGAGLITTTGGLTTSSAGGTALTGANVVNSFNATNTASGNIDLTNGRALTIAGMSQAGGGSITVNNAGGVGGTTVATTINAGAGSVSLTDTTGTLALGTNNVSGAGVTLQGVGVTQSAGSTVDAGAGDILVNGGGAAIAMGGSLTTTSNTATAATVKDATTVALPAITTGSTGTTTIGAGDITGAVTQSGTTTITTGTLAGNTTGTVTLGNAANTIPTVGAFASHGFTLNDGDVLSIAGALAGAAGGVHLISTGTISETGGGLITTTGTLTTSSVGGTTLGGANAVAALNATNATSGSFSLTNGAALNITAFTPVSGGSVTIDNAGGTTLGTAINAGTGPVTLKDTGGILALGANSVTGGGVTLQGVGVTQSAGSAVNAGAGDILVNGGGAAITMAGSLTTTSNTATAATVKNATTVALPAITTGGTGTTTIGAGDISGAVTQSGATTLSTGTLTGNTTGSVTLGNAANTIPTLGAFASNGFTLNDNGPLSIAGTLAGGAGGVHLTSTGTISETGGGLISTTGALTTHSTGGTTLGGANAVGTFGATNSNGTVTLANAAGLTITGLSQTGGGLVSVTNTTPITVSGTNSTDGGLSLTSSGGGVTLGSTGTDSLHVGTTLSVSADGSIIQQGGSSVTAANSQLTLVSPAGDLILKNAATLGPITLVGTGHDLDLEGTNQTEVTGILTGSTWTAVTVVDGTAVTLPNFTVLGALSVNAPGILQSGPLTVGTTTTLTAAASAITLSNAGNSFGGEVDFIGSAVTLANTGALISAGTASASLSETAGGTITEGAAGIQLTGAPGANTATFTVTGATHDVDLGNAANNFDTDAVTIAASGGGTVGNVRVVDVNPTSLSVALPGTLTSLVLSDTHAPITLAGGTFTGVTGTNLASGSTMLAVTAGGAITQTGALSVAGTSAFSANSGASDINLNNAGNAFSGGVMVTGNHVTVANTAGTTVAGTSTAGTLTLDAGGAVAFGTTGADSTTVTGNLVVQGLSGSGATGGPVTEAGTLSVGGTTSIDASSNDITLSNPGNSFTGAVTLIGGSVTLANAGATTLGGANNAGSLTLDAGGAVTFGTVSTDSTTVANNLVVQGASGGGAAGGAVSLAETVDVGGALDVTAPGISQSAGPLVVGGTTTLTSTGNPISLTDAGNSFGGEVDFVGSAVTLTTTGALTSSGTASGNLAETAAGKISEGAAGIMLTGTAGTNSATFTVTGGTQDVDLDPANNFNGEAVTITASGGGAVGNVAVEDTNATFVPLTLPATFTSLVLSDPNAPIAIAGVTLTGVGAGTNLVGGTTTLAVTAGGAITQTGALSVTGTSAFSANGGASDINLSNAGNAFNGGILLAGNNVTLANTVATTVAGTSVAGNLTLDAGGAVSQTGALSVAGTTSIDAGTNAITLANAANAFAGSVTLTGGAVTLANSRAITLAGANSAGSLTLDAGGAVAFGAAGSDSAIVTNGLIVQGVNGSGAAGGAVTQAGKLSVGTTASITAGANDITLGLANTFGGNVAFGGHNVTLTTGTGGLMTSGTASGNLTETSAGAITQGGALSVTGRSTLTANGGSGDITLANAGNAFTGAVTLSGAAVTLANADATTLAGAEKFASLTLDAGGAVTFGTVSTDTTTVTNALIVQGVSGSGNDGGAITQLGTLSVGTTTLIQAGANDISLGLMNTFGGGVTFNGRNVLLNAKGSLTTVTGTASGTLTAIAQGASANLNVGNLMAGGDLLLIAGSSILGTSAQATVTATDAQVRYGIEAANGQLGSATNPSQQIGFQAAPGASQVQLTVWLPAPGTQLQGTDLRPTQSDLSITKQAFQGGSISALYSPNFGLTAAQVGTTVLSSTAAVAGTQTQSAQAQSAATQGSQSVLYIDWGSYNPNVSLFGTLNPAVCLPADQRDESAGSGSGCAAASASLLKPPVPIQLAMVPTQEGWKSMPLFKLAR